MIGLGEPADPSSFRLLAGSRCGMFQIVLESQQIDAASPCAQFVVLLLWRASMTPFASRTLCLVTGEPLLSLQRSRAAKISSSVLQSCWISQPVELLSTRPVFVVGPCKQGHIGRVSVGESLVREHRHLL